MSIDRTQPDLDPGQGPGATVSALVGVAAAAFGFVATWRVARSLGTRLRRVAATTLAVAAGDPSEKERLDGLVRARTRELDARNGDLRMVLDNVGQGLLVLGRDGRPRAERSAAASRWFGDTEETFAVLLARLDPAAGASFGAAWEQLADGVLPLAAAVDQLPRSARARGRCYEMSYTPIAQGDAVERVLVVVSDVTERLEAERAGAEMGEIVAALERAMVDFDGFREFFDDAGPLVAALCREPSPAPAVDTRRALHTLRRNASLVGLSRLAALLHDFEDGLGPEGGLGPEQRAALWHCSENARGDAPGARRSTAPRRPTRSRTPTTRRCCGA